jgi:hypothetical protein
LQAGVDVVEREFSPVDDEHLFCAAAKRKAAVLDRAQVSSFVPAVGGHAVAAQFRLFPVAGKQRLRRESLDVSRRALTERRAVVADNPQ